MTDFLSRANPVVAAAIVSAAVTLFTMLAANPLRYAVDRFLLKYKLKIEYEYEQRRKLRNLIGQYVGQMLEATETLNHRLWNLYQNESRGWLRLDGDYAKFGEHYYFASCVYRFLAVFSLARRFEIEALFVDPRIAEKRDLDFVKLLKAFYWVATDVSLFEHLDYDITEARDHIFKDRLRTICDRCWANGSFVSLEEFLGANYQIDNVRPVLELFDGLRSKEKRLRWDRLVALHLFLIAFINTFGYDMQRSSQRQFIEAAERFQHYEIFANLVAWLPKLGLAKQREIAKISRAAYALSIDTFVRARSRTGSRT